MEINFKLDENGKIESVQSRCCQNSSISCIPDQSGERYVPYSTKKELSCKLDTKIDEMGLLMMQMREMTKRMKLQEKLIHEYEEKSKRKEEEMQKLQAENRHLRSLVYKRKRNSSSFSSFDDSSVTSPKETAADIDIEMDSEDDDHVVNERETIAHVGDEDQAVHAETSNLPCQESDGGYVNKVVRDSDAASAEVSEEVVDKIDKVKAPEAYGPLQKDGHGYIIFPITHCGKAGQPVTSEDGKMAEGDSQMFGTAFRNTVSFELTLTENWCIENETENITKGSNDKSPISELEKNSRVPRLHNIRSPRYCEITDGLVSPVTSSPPASGQGQCNFSGQGHIKDFRVREDRYRQRPPMPLPERRESEPCALPVSPSYEVRNQCGLIPNKEAKNNVNDVTKGTSGHRNERRLCHRHSNPELSSAANSEETVNSLVQTMKTTMEWNEAKKLLMDKSHHCTAEMAHEVLKSVIKDIYTKCASRISGSSPKENLVQNLRKYLLKKGKYDEDILTKEFLGKCICLMLNK